jgi:hypothetical protein
MYSRLISLGTISVPLESRHFKLTGWLLYKYTRKILIKINNQGPIVYLV